MMGWVLRLVLYTFVQFVDIYYDPAFAEQRKAHATVRVTVLHPFTLTRGY